MSKSRSRSSLSKPSTKSAAKRGRPLLFEDTGVIRVLVKKPPHRTGSGRDKYFRKIKNGMTVAAAVKAGVPRLQVWSLLSRKIISVS